MAKPFLIGGASMPRSGHHFLHRILMTYLGEEFGYCSFYFPWAHDYFDDCCKSIPCSKYQNEPIKVFLQKSHDFELTDPMVSADLNLVQVRRPIERLYSNFDLHVRKHPKNDTVRHFRQFALREYYYYVAFWQKWIANGPQNTMVLCYEGLKESPVREIRRVVEAAGLTADETKIQQAIEKQKVSKGGNSKYKPRVVQDHKYFDPEWTQKYSANIRNACADFTRYYP